MILRSACLVCCLLPAATVAVPAHADVLEVDAQGSRWVSGPLSETPATVDETPLATTADLSAAHTRIPAAYSAKVAELAERFDLSPALIEALVWQESRWRHDAVSPVGARGLAQLMPGTARYLGVDADDPFANLEGGARYLREQMDRFDGDIEKALAAYNAGPGRVIRSGGIPRIRETQHYVTAIMGRLTDNTGSSD